MLTLGEVLFIDLNKLSKEQKGRKNSDREIQKRIHKNKYLLRIYYGTGFINANNNNKNNSSITTKHLYFNGYDVCFHVLTYLTTHNNFTK